MRKVPRPDFFRFLFFGAGLSLTPPSLLITRPNDRGRPLFMTASIHLAGPQIFPGRVQCALTTDRAGERGSPIQRHLERENISGSGNVLKKKKSGPGRIRRNLNHFIFRPCMRAVDISYKPNFLPHQRNHKRSMDNSILKAWIPIPPEGQLPSWDWTEPGEVCFNLTVTVPTAFLHKTIALPNRTLPPAVENRLVRL